MKSRIRQAAPAGFTLIEILVSLIVLGVLAAVLFPAVTEQARAAGAPRAATDLTSVRAGIEMFAVDVGPALPGDLEDLINQISSTTSTGDKDAGGNFYTRGQENRWSGPYIDFTTGSADDVVDNTAGLRQTGFGGDLLINLVCFRPLDDSVPADADCKTGDYVAVQVNGLSVSEFLAINDIIDGDEAAGGEDDLGKWRGGPAAFAVGQTAYYLAVPFSR